jgi:hypothetical protein
MQNECTLVIDENGDCKMVLTAAAKMLNMTNSPSHRASHVEPVNPALRLIFHAVRAMVSDDSRIAAWTRTWGCTWRVNMLPVGGGLLRWNDPFGNEVAVFYTRPAAIDAEVRALNNFFIGEQS